MLLNNRLPAWMQQMGKGGFFSSSLNAHYHVANEEENSMRSKEGPNGLLAGPSHPPVQLTFASLPRVYKAIFGLLIFVIMSLLWSLWSRPYSGGAPVSSPLHQGSQATNTQDIKASSSGVRKALIIASTSRRNTTWLEKVPKDWEQYLYKNDVPTGQFSVPRNQGREAMPYLTFIIDNYYNLPDYMVFVHAHQRGWHQPEPLPYLLQALNLTAVDHHGWVNMRCSLEPSCVPERTWVDTQYTPPGLAWWSYLVRGLFSYTYREGDPWYNASWPLIKGIRIPPQFASPCCAQFAVTKAATLAKPLEFWERLRSPLLRDLSEFNPIWWPGLKMKDLGQFQGVNHWNIGVAYERLWHFFFDQPAITCLDEDYCKKVIYQDRIRCNGTTSRWKISQNFMWISCQLFDDMGAGVLAQNDVGEGTY